MLSGPLVSRRHHEVKSVHERTSFFVLQQVAHAFIAGYAQLTHGFHYYPAGMQAVAAQHLISTIPESSETILDPFCGSGTTRERNSCMRSLLVLHQCQGASQHDLVTALQLSKHFATGVLPSELTRHH